MTGLDVVQLLQQQHVERRQELLGGQDDSGGEPVRLNKRLSELGLCSRRESDVYIQRGLVLVDGAVVDA